MPEGSLRKASLTASSALPVTKSAPEKHYQTCHIYQKYKIFTLIKTATHWVAVFIDSLAVSLRR